ncbi:MAG TPA: hypothetical protein VEX86_12925 [Longimicrobium sp.]|nr:hypothetical protein [Longimicrobium sp.]
MLDEMEAVHGVVGGGRTARRFARQQVAQAYVVLLASQFQLFCRELHTESAEWVTDDPAHEPLNLVLRTLLTTGRRLDVGNANSATLGSDFGKLGISFWDEVRRHRGANVQRKARLEELNCWRNAIAHQDFRNPGLAGSHEVRFQQVRAWRRTCDALAVEFDAVLRLYLMKLVGGAPW